MENAAKKVYLRSPSAKANGGDQGSEILLRILSAVERQADDVRQIRNFIAACMIFWLLAMLVFAVVGVL